MNKHEYVEIGAFAQDPDTGQWLQAVESDHWCYGCYFFDANPCPQHFYCSAYSRKDGSFVIFKPALVSKPDLYRSLKQVLVDAEHQASQGKGKERHATDNNFEDQLICTIQKMLRDHPFGGQAFQVIKKTVEAGRLYQQGETVMAYNEILGAINYLGAMGHMTKTER